MNSFLRPNSEVYKYKKYKYKKKWYVLICMNKEWTKNYIQYSKCIDLPLYARKILSESSCFYMVKKVKMFVIFGSKRSKDQGHWAGVCKRRSGSSQA